MSENVDLNQKNSDETLPEKDSDENGNIFGFQVGMLGCVMLILEIICSLFQPVYIIDVLIGLLVAALFIAIQICPRFKELIHFGVKNKMLVNFFNIVAGFAVIWFFTVKVFPDYACEIWIIGLAVLICIVWMIFCIITGKRHS